MTLKEKKSQRKANAIRVLVGTGEYSLSYAMMKTEELNDSGLLLDTDYEALAEWLESLLNQPEEPEASEEENSLS